MKKIYKLFINENIKTWKKLSTALAIAFCITALIATLGIAKFMEYANEKSKTDFFQNNDWRKQAQEKIQECEQELQDDTLSEDDRNKLETTKEVYNLSLKYNINISSSDWRANVLRLIGVYEVDKKLVKLIEKDDFAGYIQMKRDDNKQFLLENQMTQEEYDDEMLILDLYSKYEIGRNQSEDTNIDWREIVISEIRQMQQDLRRGIDVETNKILSVEKKHEFEDRIKMDIYRIENNIIPLEYNDTSSRMIFEIFAISVEIAIIAILAIIIAGGAISSETSSGTIKFWALTPNKRWKILTAKILSLLFYIVIFTLIMAFLTIACSNIFFDVQGNEYIYVKDGNVENIGNTLFIIGYYFTQMIPVIVFALFALMLSVLTRNSSVSIGISVATYMGSGVTMNILNTIITKDWMKFVPFNNLNIFEKIFPNFQGLTESTQFIATSSSLQFSLAVLGVCVVLMLVTAYDSFNNRDIT